MRETEGHTHTHKREIFKVLRVTESFFPFHLNKKNDGPKRILEIGFDVTEAVGEATVEAILNLSALRAALRRLRISASSSVISDS